MIAYNLIQIGILILKAGYPMSIFKARPIYLIDKLIGKFVKLNSMFNVCNYE